MKQMIVLTINGTQRSIEAELGDTLLEVLRRERIKSVKLGCDTGDCGSCAVLLNGRAANACMVLAIAADGKDVDTAEGLERDGHLHPMQQAMVDAGAVQCGFCTPGILMSGIDLLSHNPDPTEDEIKEALGGNLCRCTGYVKQVDAIGMTARLQAGETDA